MMVCERSSRTMSGDEEVQRRANLNFWRAGTQSWKGPGWCNSWGVEVQNKEIVPLN